MLALDVILPATLQKISGSLILRLILGINWRILVELHEMLQLVLVLAIRDTSEPDRHLIIILKMISGNMIQLIIPGHKKRISGVWEEWEQPVLVLVIRDTSE